MLSSLRIVGLGVIEESEIEPAAGLTAITGETGAGKTMIVTGLGLLLGARADASIVRNGARRAQVEARFTGFEGLGERLEEIGADVGDGDLLVARHVRENGRSRAWVGGVQTPIGTAGEVVAQMATIHGQSEQIRLASPERQREILDRHAGQECLRLLADYHQLFERRRALADELGERIENARERAQQADLLRFGLDEIAAVDPQPGEDDDLAAKAVRLQGLDDLRMLAQQASHALAGADDGDVDDPGALGLVGQARKQTRRIAELDPDASGLAERLDQIAMAIGEVAGDLASYLADLDADPQGLETITSRRAALAALTRKYGADIDEVLAWAQQSRERLLDLDTDESRIAELRAQVQVMDEEILERARHLHEVRADAAQTLAAEVQAELGALAMPHARLNFRLDPLPQPRSFGIDAVHLLFSANLGSEPAPLAKMASGGELSRVRLALEVVLAGTDPGHTFVFDEVDAGVGGRVAIEIGKRLARLAKHSQVIIVTHLAQVAAFADRHYVVTKSSEGPVTASDIRLVDGDQRLRELARLMAGTESATALAHARELLEQARHSC